MRTGEPTVERRAQRGFTYLLLLIALAVGGAGLAALGERWSLQAQREREAELVFRGEAIRQAIDSYRAATPEGQPDLPKTLDELLEDRRQPQPVRYLRRLYADPFSGRADWGLVRAADGRIRGVYSRSRAWALRRFDAHGEPLAVAAGRGAHDPVRVGDWRFAVEPSAVPDAPSSEPYNPAYDPAWEPVEDGGGSPPPAAP